jgi:hypothetical protein
LQADMGLIPFGFGGQMMNQIEKLKLVFQYQHSIDVEMGRNLLIQSARIFLDEINSNESIRSYLSNYPFVSSNIIIVIALLKPDSSNTEKGELSLIALRDGMLQYKFDDPNSSRFRVIEETYEQALEKLRF